MSEPKPRFPRALACQVLKELLPLLLPACQIIRVAGSFRRMKPDVGDLELVFVPHYRDGTRSDLLLPPPKIALTDSILDHLLATGTLARRTNVKGGTAWGEKNKLAIHVQSGLPVDLFTASNRNFANYLVCRTGGAITNVRISTAAIAKGWKWNPYDTGFSRPSVEPGEREIHPCPSERAVFEFVGLPYLPPEQRE